MTQDLARSSNTAILRRCLAGAEGGRERTGGSGGGGGRSVGLPSDVLLLTRLQEKDYYYVLFKLL